MKILKFLSVIFFLVLFSNCDKEKLSPELDYLIFGRFAGFCGGEACIEIFKLTGSALYEDINDEYPSVSNQNFDFQSLPDSTFQKVKDLAEDIPEQLWDEADGTFGCPDCADQGGFFVQYVKGETVKTWGIDTNKNAVPSYLHDFMDAINAKIELINP